MQDRSRNMPRWPLALLALAAVLVAPTLCVAPRPTEPPASPRQALSSAGPNADGRRPRVASQDAGADAVVELLRRSVEAYEALGARVAEANLHPDQRALLQALRAVCARNALHAALDAYLAEGTDPVAHMRAHARRASDDTERTCERAVLSAAGLLESQLAFAHHVDGGSAARGPVDAADVGRRVLPATGSLP